MLNLAPLRYRNILVENGGVVGRLESGPFPVRGRTLRLANAWLAPGLIRKGTLVLYGDADGSGIDAIAAVARHKAVSEALERWAFHSVVRSERAAEFGFDVDPSTTGMSAFPGWSRRAGRRKALLEAVERFSLCAWWEGLVGARQFETDWPGVSSIAIDGPFSGICVVAWACTEWGGYVYGHAAEESFGAACASAVLELARHEGLLRAAWLASVSGKPPQPTHLFERRCLFFASDRGHELFMERVHRSREGPRPRVEVICDAHIPGPWDEYATVWRFALRPPSDGYLRGGEEYFFL